MDTTTTFVNQIVLLGASNLTRALATTVEAAQRICGRPSRVLIAAGHGRSYGVYSQVLFRGLPGIIHCGLWDDLVKGPTLPTFALLTDLGNDIAFEISVEKIIDWVGWCLARLAEHRARIIVTTLPVQGLEGLSPWEYRFFRAVLFPGRHLTLQQALDRAHAINIALRQQALERAFTVVEQRPQWYGVDPIHIRVSSQQPMMTFSGTGLTATVMKSRSAGPPCDASYDYGSSRRNTSAYSDPIGIGSSRRVSSRTARRSRFTKDESRLKGGMHRRLRLAPSFPHRRAATR
jgi:hypothetical protein